MVWVVAAEKAFERAAAEAAGVRLVVGVVSEAKVVDVIDGLRGRIGTGLRIGGPDLFTYRTDCVLLVVFFLDS